MKDVPHKHELPEVTYGVITVSDSCYNGKKEDKSGKYLLEKLQGEEHTVVPDDEEAITSAVKKMIEKVDVVVTTGGTGLSRRDVTREALAPLFDKEIPGFGEVFRMMSFDEVGTACILSSASAGTVGDKLVFCLPGSINAVKVGVSIIEEEAAHIIKHLRE